MNSFIVGYYSLFLVIIGTLLNSLTLIILCRSTFRNRTGKSTFYYMRAIVIFDILMLYGWNLDHYLSLVHGFTIQTLTIPLCRFLSFFNYFVLQSSAWFRVFICIDRYLSLRCLHRTWFYHSKNVPIIIGCIITSCFALNTIFFFYGCSVTTTGAISAESWAFQIYPLWNYINLGVYNCAPFVLMMIFNTSIIYHLFHFHHSLRIQHRSISITLLITTSLFPIMTIPSTVAVAFFPQQITLLFLLDGILYSYHIMSWPLYFITYNKFRRECLAMIECGNINVTTVKYYRYSRNDLFGMLKSILKNEERKKL